VLKLQRHLYWRLGRLRDVIEGLDKVPHIAASNPDGRGRLGSDDDR